MTTGNGSDSRSSGKDAVDVGAVVAPMLEAIERMRSVDMIFRSSVTSCPGCSDGSLTLSDRVTGKTMRRPCHLVAKDCGYGQLLMRRMNDAVLQRLRQSGVPARFLDTLPTPRRTIALMKALSWNRRGFLTVTGPTGTGKSFAAASVLFEATRTRMERVWREPGEWAKSGVGSWISAYRASTNRDDFAAALACGFLVVDDLGEEVNTPGVKAAMKEVVSDRYNQNRPTIVTSNLSVLEIRDRYGDRMTERLVEGGMVVECSGESMRLRTEAA